MPVLLDEAVAALAPARRRPSMSTARSAPAAIARRCCGGALPRRRASTAIPPPSPRGEAPGASSCRPPHPDRRPLRRDGALLAALGITPVAGIALDLGVSSPQIDDPARGFSFRADGPLDMRMGARRRAAPPTSSTTLPEGDARRPHPSSMARSASPAASPAPSSPRAEAPLDPHQRARRSSSAASCRRAGGIDPATRTFQALRIAVNDELGELDRGLAAAERLLDAGRPARRRLLPFARRPPRQRFPAPAQRRRAARLAPSPRRAPRPAPSFALIDAQAGRARRRRARAQSARPLRPAARRRAHRRAAWEDARMIRLGTIVWWLCVAVQSATRCSRSNTK